MASPTAAASDRRDEQHRPAAEAVGERGGERRRHRHEQRRHAQHREEVGARDMQRRHAVAEREHRRDVEQRVADDDRQRTLDQRPPMVADRFDERDSSALARLDQRAEGGRLGDRHADIEADRHQRGAEQERDAPRPGDEALFAQRRGSAAGTGRWPSGSRSAARAAGTCRTRRAGRAARSRSPAAPRRPIRRRARRPGRSAAGTAARARARRPWNSRAARRSASSTGP